MKKVPVCSLSVKHAKFLKMLGTLTYSEQLLYDLSKADLLFIKDILSYNFYLDSDRESLNIIRIKYLIHR